MDKNTVFSKTGEGEDAVRERTRLVQRNLRNILIMVDGLSTVAELGRRFGNPDVVERALAELESEGFVTAARPGSAAEPSLDFTAADKESGEDDIPVLNVPVTPQQPAPAAQPVVEEIVITPLQDELEWSSQAPDLAPDLAPPWKSAEPAKKAGPGWPDLLKGALDRLKKKWAAKPRRLPLEKPEGKDIGQVTIKPVRQGPRIILSWPLLVAIALAGVPALLALAALLFPYERYLPDIERQASEAVGEPVKIGRIGFSFLPQPNITLTGIEVGNDRHITVGVLRAVPDFFSLLGEKKVFREMQLERILVTNRGLGRIPLWQGGRDGPAIRQVSLSGLSVEIGGATIDGMGGEVQMAPGGRPEKIHLRNADSSLRLDAQPEGAGYVIAVSCSKWKAPISPSLTFDYLDAEGVLGATRLDLSRIEGKLYEGLISGSGSLDWSRGAVLAGDIETKRLSLARFLAAISPEFAGEGDVSSKIRLESKADSLGMLADNLRVDASFDIGRGAINGFDLGEAVRSTGRSPTRGGITRFEQFSGNLQFEKQSRRLTNLRMSSGLLKAAGQLNIGKDKRLNGAIDVEVRGSAALIKVPVAVGGTVDASWLMPVKGALAGSPGAGQR